jgi:hypothetical protein
MDQNVHSILKKQPRLLSQGILMFVISFAIAIILMLISLA